MAGVAPPIGERLTASGAVSPEAVAAAPGGATAHGLAARRDPARVGCAARRPARAAAGRAVGPPVARQRRRARPGGARRRHRVAPLRRPGAHRRRRPLRDVRAPAPAPARRAARGGRSRRPRDHDAQRVKELTTAGYREEGLARATFHLRDVRPEASASRVLSSGQKAFGIALVVAIVVCAALWPLTTGTVLLAAATTYYLANSLYKYRLAFDSLSGAGNIPVSDEEVAALNERTLPIYTILVPLYKEAAIVPPWSRDISRARLPADQARREAALRGGRRGDRRGDRAHGPAAALRDRRRARRPAEDQAEGVQLRPAAGARRDTSSSSMPRTARSPTSSRRSSIAFAKATGNVVCVQAKLNYYNRDQNLLTRWFPTEYSMWFDLLLPGLDATDVADPARRHVEPLHHRDACASSAAGTRST